MVKLRKPLKLFVVFIIFCSIVLEPSFLRKSLEVSLSKLNIEYQANNIKVLAVDVGNNNDYEDPSYDYDDSGYDYNNRYYDDGYSGGYGGSLGPGTLIVLAIIVILYFVLKKKGLLDNTGTNGTSTTNNIVYMSPKNLYVPDNTQKIMDAITKTDPLFSAEKFLSWAQEVFITLQEAWTERDWSKIRPFEKEELFKMHEKQLQEYIRMKRINIVERISINEDHLYKYERNAEYEYLQVYLGVAMNDYIIDEETREVVKGNPNIRYKAKYLLTFMRKVGVLTDPASSNMNTTRCPHCGAPVQVTSAGKCEYCDSIITTGEHDWVLSDLDCIKQGTHIGPGGVFIQKRDNN